MKNAIILHGLADKDEYYSDVYPSCSNSHWIPWLQKQLIINDIKADTPEIPKPFEFNWDSWVTEVERFDINANTSLIGHSMGGGFWLKYLSDNPDIKVEKLILVAPWLNLNHIKDTPFFNFEINNSIKDQVNKIVIFVSDDDSKEIQDSVNLICQKLPSAILKEFHGYGHFTFGKMKTTSFPELLEVIL